MEFGSINTRLCHWKFAKKAQLLQKRPELIAPKHKQVSKSIRESKTPIHLSQDLMTNRTVVKTLTIKSKKLPQAQAIVPSSAMSLRCKQDHWQLLSWYTQDVILLLQKRRLHLCRESWEIVGISKQKKNSEWLTILPDWRQENSPSIGLPVKKLIVIRATRAYLLSVVLRNLGKSLGSSVFTRKFVRIVWCSRTSMTLLIASWYEWTSNMPCSHSSWRIKSTGIKQSSLQVRILTWSLTQETTERLNTSIMSRWRKETLPLSALRLNAFLESSLMRKT